MAQRSHLLAGLIILCLFSPLAAANEETTASENVVLLDFAVIDFSCYDEGDCTAWKADHLVEYFGADWCEPCISVEDDLANMNRSDTVILQHHPSTHDQTFYNESKLRFDNHYRLLFIPTIVIDSAGLLSGHTQALELNAALDNTSTHYSGIENTYLNNTNLTWKVNTGDVLRVWRLDETAHESRNFTHKYLATDSLLLNGSEGEMDLSDFLEGWQGRLIFTLESNEIPTLVSKSSNPTGSIDFNQNNSGSEEPYQYSKPNGNIALMVFLGLVLILIPAFYLWSRESQAPWPKNSSEEE